MGDSSSRSSRGSSSSSRSAELARVVLDYQNRLLLLNKKIVDGRYYIGTRGQRIWLTREKQARCKRGELSGVVSGCAQPGQPVSAPAPVHAPEGAVTVPVYMYTNKRALALGQSAAKRIESDGPKPESRGTKRRDPSPPPSSSAQRVKTNT